VRHQCRWKEKSEEEAKKGQRNGLTKNCFFVGKMHFTLRQTEMIFLPCWKSLGKALSSAGIT
jgi:hypothetical protein